MLIKLFISNFRNIDRKLFGFEKGTTLIKGANASGKTNILEVIYLLSTGKSFRAGLEAEMIQTGKDLTRVKGKFSENLKLEVLLTQGEIVSEGVRQVTPKKKLLVNGIPRRLTDFAGQFKVVLFVPQDLDLVTQSPSLRRRFLDMVLFQTDGQYRRNLLAYEKALRRRNKILFKIREEGLPKSNLVFWDELLLRNGDYITRKRAEFIEFVNRDGSLGDREFEIHYDKNAVTEERFEKYWDREVASATTLVGPHRDDFVVKLKTQSSILKTRNAVDLSIYGSRGEQRMGVLWLKLRELEHIVSETEIKPTLLLDDIFSELDNEHREMVWGIAKNYQSIITTADGEKEKKSVKIIGI